MGRGCNDRRNHIKMEENQKTKAAHEMTLDNYPFIMFTSNFFSLFLFLLSVVVFLLLSARRSVCAIVEKLIKL